MFPANARQFSLAFLDLQRNKEGYVSDIRTSDKEVAKRLLTPFYPASRWIGDAAEERESCIYVPPRHQLGHKMWIFASECTAMESSACATKSRGADSNLQQSKTVLHTRRGFEPSCFPVEALNSKFVERFQSSVTKEYLESGDGAPREQNLRISKQLRTTSSSEDIVASDTEHIKRNTQSVVDERADSRRSYGINDRCKFSPDFTGSANNADSYYKAELHPDILSTKSAENKFRPLKLAQDFSPVTFNHDAKCNSEVEEKVDMPQSSEPSAILEEGKLQESQSRESFPENNVHMTSLENEENYLLELERRSFSAEVCKSVVQGDTNQRLLSNSERGKNHFPNVVIEESCVKPLSLLKQTHNRNMSSRTVKFDFQMLKSVIEKKLMHITGEDVNEVEICGRIAVLFGSDEEIVRVFERELVGIYDYVSGKVIKQDSGCDADKLQDTKVLTENVAYTDLEIFLAQLYHRFAKTPLTSPVSETLLRMHLPVAWLLTSPALGVNLDWQVHAKYKEFQRHLNNNKSFSSRESEVAGQEKVQWYNLLVVLDEYRCVEKGVPLMEVYELCSDGSVDLVSFDMN